MYANLKTIWYIASHGHIVIVN